MSLERSPSLITSTNRYSYSQRSTWFWFIEIYKTSTQSAFASLSKEKWSAHQSPFKLRPVTRMQSRLTQLRSPSTTGRWALPSVSQVSDYPRLLTPTSSLSCTMLHQVATMMCIDFRWAFNATLWICNSKKFWRLARMTSFNLVFSHASGSSASESMKSKTNLQRRRTNLQPRFMERPRLIVFSHLKNSAWQQVSIKPRRKTSHLKWSSSVLASNTL